MRVLKLTSLLLVVLVALFSGTAAADSTFHTLHAALKPVGANPLQSGFVNDVHTNGVVNAAHEIYHLAGASPNTTYAVSINLYIADPSCSSAPVAFPTTQLTTNGAGNGNARFTFPAGPPSGLEGFVSGIRWTLTGPAGPGLHDGLPPADARLTLNVTNLTAPRDGTAARAAPPSPSAALRRPTAA